MLLKNKLPFWIALNSYVEMIVSGVPPLSLSKAKTKPIKNLIAFGGTEQRNLPDNYIERQYIYMMDSSYLLTDIVPTPDCKIEFDFQTLTIVSGARTYLGCRDTSGSNDGLRVAHISNGKFRIYGFGTYADSATAAQANTRYKFIWNNKQATITTGGTTVFNNTFAAEGTNQTAVAINGWNTAGTVDANSEGIYLYSFKAWNGQGELVMDLVPAVQKGTVPVVGFYDTVSETFKTATAGTFAAGGEAVPAPNAPMDIICNNGVLKARHQSGLPLGYTLLDYIESTGTQYIDTGVYVATGYKVRVKAYATSLPTTSAFFGCTSTAISSDANKGIYRIFGSSINRCAWGNGSGTVVGNLIGNDSINTWYDMVCDNGAWTINDALFATCPESSFASEYSMWLFARNTAGTVGLPSSCRISVCQIWDNNGQMIRNLVPCKNASNVIGVYDLVNGVFYQNAGTGTFTAGSAVSDPVEVYADGLQETINIHTKNLFDKNHLPERIYAYFANSGTSWLYASSGYSLRFPCLPNTTYTARYNGNSTQTVLSFASTSNDTVPTSGQTNVTVTQAIRQNVPTINTPITLTTGANDKWLIVQYNAVEPENTNMANNLQIELGSTATTYVPYYDGGTAVAEMLLKVNTYQDVQSIIDGVVTRNVGIKVFDGTEAWSAGSAQNPNRFILAGAFNDIAQIPNENVGYSNCYTVIARSSNIQSILQNNECGWNTTYVVCVRDDRFDTVAQFTAWLADQYAAGTPVVIIYPLKTSTTETVTGQPMATTEDDNIADITQASMSGLELSVKYIKGV